MQKGEVLQVELQFVLRTAGELLRPGPDLLRSSSDLLRSGPELLRSGRRLRHRLCSVVRRSGGRCGSSGAAG